MRTAFLVGTLVVLVTAPAARAHEHMYIGSNRPHGGTLVLRYDFTRAFPVVPLPNGTGFIGTDPAFNAQVTDDATDGIYTLKNHTHVKMQLTAIDPQLTVNFNGVIMKAPGDRASIGRMPYLHQHPQWTLDVPPGVTGDWHLSFRVLAKGYQPSQPYTATVTNIVEVTTTTTTLPGPGCAEVGCDDHDGCTADSCVAGTCHNDPLTGVDAVRCRIAKVQAELDDVRPTTAKGRRALARMFKVVNTVEPALQAVAAGGADAPRKLRRAEKQLNRFSTLVDAAQHVGAMDSGDGDTLRTLAGDAYDQLVLLSPWEGRR